MKDVLVVVDAFNDFEHEDGDRLLASFRERLSGLVGALEGARAAGIPVVYVNDQHGSWDGDRSAVVRRALEGKGGDAVAVVVPRAGEPFLLKARYSAFDHTGLELLLAEIRAERILLAGGSTEGCIVQTGIHARELGLLVTILTSACSTVDTEREQLALRYAKDVAGIRVAADFATLEPAA